MKHLYVTIIFCLVSTLSWSQSDNTGELKSASSSASMSYDISDVIELLLDYEYLNDSFQDYYPGGYHYGIGHYHGWYSWNRWHGWSNRHSTYNYIKTKLNDKVIRSVLISKYYTDTVAALVLDSAVVMAHDAFYNSIDSASVLVNKSQQFVLDSATIMSNNAFFNAVDSASIMASISQKIAIDSSVVLSNIALKNSIDSSIVLVNKSQQLVLDSTIILDKASFTNAVDSANELTNQAFIGAIDSARLYSSAVRELLTEMIIDSISITRSELKDYTQQQVLDVKIEGLTVDENKNIAIGKEKADYTLDVGGTIRAEEIIVEANGKTADFVFEDGYELKDLSEVHNFIKEKKHLPGIPSASEMEASGVNLAEMNKLLLQKVEELTLYTILQSKEIESKNSKIVNLEFRLDQMNAESANAKEEREELEEKLLSIEQMLVNREK